MLITRRNYSNLRAGSASPSRPFSRTAEEDPRCVTPEQCADNEVVGFIIPTFAFLGNERCALIAEKIPINRLAPLLAISISHFEKLHCQNFRLHFSTSLRATNLIGRFDGPARRDLKHNNPCVLAPGMPTSTCGGARAFARINRRRRPFGRGSIRGNRP